MNKKFKVVLSIFLSLVMATVLQMKTAIPVTATPTDYSYFLSDYSYNSALTTADFTPIRMNQSFGGSIIKVNEITYAKGIGTHSNSTIVYDLKQNFNLFTAYVGVDSEVGSDNGSVIFKVKVDGVQKYQSPTLTYSSTAQQVIVDITGASRLELIVDKADGSYSNDHADWVEAKVTKTAPSSTLTLTADTGLADSIALQAGFQWAKDKALSYVKTANKFDYIPSYFAAMHDDSPNNKGQFCARDVAHYMEGAHLLGLDLENFSMMKTFAWGANGRVGPQTTDYYWPRWWYNYDLKNSDGSPNEDFGSSQWRTLPTAFDMVWRSYEQYLWTGDSKWINDTEMFNFYTNIQTNFMDKQGKNTHGAATETKQLASYYEFPNPSEHFVVAGDSIGCQYQSLLAYSNILAKKGLAVDAQTYKAKADALRSNFEANWFDTANNRYVRGFGPGKVTGTQFGTAGSYNNDPNATSEKATDGNINTWFDSPNPNGDYTGIDLGAGNEKRIYKIRYYPRNGWASRMVGGKFQGSNTSQTAGFVDLHTIETTPAPGVFTEVTVGDTTPYRYLRYLSPNGGYCNVAEIGFYTSSGKNFRSNWGRENSFFMPMTLITDNASRTDNYLEFIKNSVDNMETSGNALNIEAQTYLPETFYKHGKNEYGWKYLKQIMDSRHNYPEVSFVSIGSTISGLMGVTPDAPNNTVKTLPRLPAATKIPWVEVDHIKVGGNDLKIRHDGNTKTTLTNNSGGAITWKACFDGSISQLYKNGTPENATQEVLNGKTISYVSVSVPAGGTVVVKTTP